MKYLIDDLVPEVEELLEVDAEQYPYLIAAIKQELSEKVVVMDLSVSIANSLISYENRVNPENYGMNFILNLYKVFGR